MRKRIYHNIEQYLWDDDRFYKLSLEGQYMWLYLLTTSRRTALPGLLLASEMSIGEQIRWIDINDSDSIMSGLKRVRSAINEIENMITSDGARWIEVDRKAKVIFISRAIFHQPPVNINQIKHWIKTIYELPKTPLLLKWIDNARRIVRRMYGTEDKRYEIFDTLYRSGIQKQDVGGEPKSETVNRVIDSIDVDITQSAKDNSGEIEPQLNLNRTSIEPQLNLNRTSIEPTGEELYETIDEDEWVSYTHPESINININTNTNNNTTTSAPHTTPPANEDDLENEDHTRDRDCTNDNSRNVQDSATRNPGLAIAPDLPEDEDDLPERPLLPKKPKKTKNPKKVKPSLRYIAEGKPTTPPDGFNARQREMWDAMCSATFLIKDRGMMTAWQAVDDPVIVAGQLGGVAYPLVDASLIHTLGNWTIANSERAKIDVHRFLINRFAAEQKEKYNSRQRATPSLRSSAADDDLEEKIRRMNEGG